MVIAKKKKEQEDEVLASCLPFRWFPMERGASNKSFRLPTI
jgi:hypothetical protein